MLNFSKWAYRTVRKHGVGGTIGLGVKKLKAKARMLDPKHRRQVTQLGEEERHFDARHNVDTAGYISLSALEIPSANRDKCNLYGPCYQRTFEEIMRAAGPFPADCTFLDYGCGKGRALMLAAEFPFRSVVGVEFSPQLVEVARKNLRQCKEFNFKCTNIEVECMDATEYDPPLTPLFIYINNSFLEEVMGLVVKRIRASLERHPRPVIFVYETPLFEHLLVHIPQLQKRMAKGRAFSIYQYDGAPAAEPAMTPASLVPA